MTEFFFDEDFPCNQVEFKERFNTDQACRDYLANMKWPERLNMARKTIDLLVQSHVVAAVEKKQKTWPQPIEGGSELLCQYFGAINKSQPHTLQYRED